MEHNAPDRVLREYAEAKDPAAAERLLVQNWRFRARRKRRTWTMSRRMLLMELISRLRSVRGGTGR